MNAFWGEGGEGVGYEVHRYATQRQASRELARVRYSFFADRETRVSWEKPPEIEYVSPVADEYILACGLLNERQRCGMAAVYQEYFVFYNAVMSEDQMTFQDFKQALTFIDAQMAHYLYGDK
jgi:hypothetical protein